MLDQNGENPKNVFFVGAFVSPVGRAINSTTGLDYGHRLLGTCSLKVT